MTGPRHGRCESRDVNLAPWDTRVLGCLLTEEAAESLNSTCDSSFAGGVEGPLKASARLGPQSPHLRLKGNEIKQPCQGLHPSPVAFGWPGKGVLF